MEKVRWRRRQACRRASVIEAMVGKEVGRMVLGMEAMGSKHGGRMSHGMGGRNGDLGGRTKALGGLPSALYAR